MSYYYFIATLPMLGFNSPPPMDLVRFRELCSEALSNSDFSTLTSLLDGGESGNRFVKEWRNCDTQICNAVARQRAIRLGTAADAAKWIRPQTGIEVFIDNAVAAAFQEADPMARELALARLRWTKLEDTAALTIFHCRISLHIQSSLRY